MTAAQPEKRKLLFTAISGFCVLVSSLLLRTTLSRVDQGEALAGYSGLSIGFSFLVALVLTGLITGQIGLIRGEKPLVLPILALLLNGIIFIAAVVLIPR